MADGNNGRPRYPPKPAKHPGPKPAPGEEQVGGRYDNRPRETWKPEDGYAAGLNRPQCCAHRRRQNGGGRCLNVPVRGRRTCRKHGGTVRGKMTRGGLYSRHLGVLRTAYEEALARERMLDTEDQVALFDAKTCELLERLQADKDSPRFRAEALGKVRALETAFAAGDVTRVQAAMRALVAHVEAGADADRAMREALELAERRAKMADRSKDLTLRRAQTVTSAQLVVIFGAFLEIVRQHADVQVAQRIVDAIGSRMLERGRTRPPGVP